MTRYLSVKDICALFGVSKVTFYRWQKDPGRPTIHPAPKLLPMVRFTQEDVDAYLEANGGAGGGVDLPQNDNSKPLQTVGAE